MEADIEERDREDYESGQINGFGFESDEAEEEPASEHDEDKSNHETKRRIDPTAKPRTVRIPQPKLDAELLKGPKGVQTVEKYFEGFKYNGKGHEKYDLNRIMKRLEHWAHRLYPKFQFDDFLEKVAILEKKKDLQVHVKKYRLNMLNEDDGIIREEMDVDDNEQIDNTPIDEFDLLLAEQIAKQKQVVVDDQTNMDTSMSKPNTSASDDPIFNTSIVSNTSRKDVSPIRNLPTLTKEMKQRIERNRQLAMERRLERMKMREEKTEAVDKNICSIETTSNNISQQMTQQHKEDVTTNETTLNSVGDDIGPLEIINIEKNENCEPSHTQNSTVIMKNEESTSVTNNVDHDLSKENGNVETKTDVITSNNVLTNNELRMEINAVVHELVNARKQQNE